MWTDTVSRPRNGPRSVPGHPRLIRCAKKSARDRNPGRSRHQGRQIAGPAWSSTWWTRCCSFEGGGSQQFRILRAVRTARSTEKSACSDDGLGCAMSPILRMFLSERDSASQRHGSLRRDGGHPAVWWNCKLVARPRRTPRRAGSAGFKRLSMVLAVLGRIAGFKLAATTFIFNVAAGCAFRNGRRSRRAAGGASLANARCRRAVYFGDVSLFRRGGVRWRKPHALKEAANSLRPRRTAGSGARRGRRRAGIVARSAA